jgi:flagellar basal-body rod protein FlgG
VQIDVGAPSAKSLPFRTDVLEAISRAWELKMQANAFPAYTLAISTLLLVGCGRKAAPTQQADFHPDSQVRPASFSEPAELLKAELQQPVPLPMTSLPAEVNGMLDGAIRTTKIQLEVATNNLANAHTTAFKASRVLLTEGSYQQRSTSGRMDAVGNHAAAGTAIGNGVQVGAVQLDMSQGKLVTTGRELDVAIDGDGFFQVQDPTGQILYTRCGTFSRNRNGQLCLCSAGVSRLIEPNISIPQDALRISIGEDGIVSVLQFGSPQEHLYGQIQIAQFINYEGLRPVGDGLFAESQASGAPIIGNPGANAAGPLRQGMLEASNVDIDETRAQWNRAQQQLAMLIQLRAAKSGNDPLQD